MDARGSAGLAGQFFRSTGTEAEWQDGPGLQEVLAQSNDAGALAIENLESIVPTNGSSSAAN